MQIIASNCVLEKYISVYHVRNQKVNVDAFSERQSLNKNWWRCSLVKRGRSAAQGRTVRDLEQGQRFPA
jgi:hypothetical protein